MDSDVITRLLVSQFPECEVRVEGGDGKYLVTVVGAVFQGLNAVKRQQRIYSVLNDHIASGDIHAVSMRLFTADEADAASAGS